MGEEEPQGEDYNGFALLALLRHVKSLEKPIEGFGATSNVLTTKAEELAALTREQRVELLGES